ncbi:MAG: hypothetical protein GY847_09075 [Proteobacteria bacterium]|nr:hypothetical protein [Pseudomonadota bacterium]
MSELLSTLRALVRDELKRLRLPELGVVTEVFPKDSDSGDGNHQVNIKLQASGVELIRVPVAVGRLGLSALPNVDDLMVVTFVGGDLNAPVAIGCLYDDQAHPPVAAEQEVVYQPPDEEDSAARRFHLELPSGGLITVQDEVVTVEMGGSAVVVNKDGDVEITAAGDLTLKADGAVSVEAGGDLNLQAGGKLAAKGMTASVEGDTEAKLKGAKVGLAGMTEFTPS